MRVSLIVAGLAVGANAATPVGSFLGNSCKNNCGLDNRGKQPNIPAYTPPPAGTNYIQPRAVTNFAPRPYAVQSGFGSAFPVATNFAGFNTVPAGFAAARPANFVGGADASSVAGASLFRSGARSGSDETDNGDLRRQFVGNNAGLIGTNFGFPAGFAPTQFAPRGFAPVVTTPRVAPVQACGQWGGCCSCDNQCKTVGDCCNDYDYWCLNGGVAINPVATAAPTVFVATAAPTNPPTIPTRPVVPARGAITVTAPRASRPDRPRTSRGSTTRATAAPVRPTDAPVRPTDAPVRPTDAPVRPTDAPDSTPTRPPTDAPLVRPTDAPEPTTAPRGAARPDRGALIMSRGRS